MGAPAEICNCSAIRQAERHVARLYERAFAPLGLTIDQYATLSKLGRLGSSSITGLGELLSMDRAMLSYVTKGLLARDLIAVTRAEGDARCRLVALTDAGSTLLAEARVRWNAANAQIDAALGDNAPVLRQLLKQVETLDLRHEAPAPELASAF